LSDVYDSAITLTTDFGVGSPYVAAMKGAILSIHPRAVIVDLTHSIEPQNVRQGALVLAETTPCFAPDTIHVAVVDPGVGSDRKIVYAEINGRRYIAPDNGLLSSLARRNRPDRIIELAEPEFWLPNVSATFHGRDVMAPVAARLGLGLDPTRLGPTLREIVHLDWPEVCIVPGKIEGSVESIDSFGNLITDVTQAALADVPRDESTTIRCEEHETNGIFTTYADQPELTLIALIGSSGRLELAIVNENASLMLGVKVGDRVTVAWPTS
jgi:hypothetical protein